MSTTVTYYLTNTASAVLATANQMLANVATSATLTNNNTNLVANTKGWIELWSQGNASAQTGASVKPGPSGHGWMDDSGTLTSNVLNSGQWVQLLPLELTATGTFVADVHVRVWEYTASSGTYTFIAELLLSSETLVSTSYTDISAQVANAFASGQFASGQHVYIDCLLNILTNTSSANVRVQMANSSTAGNTSAQLTTPGYNSAAYNAEQMTYDELQTQYARIRASSLDADLQLLAFTYYVPTQILNEHALPGELDALFSWDTWTDLIAMRTVNAVTDFLEGTVNQLTIFNVKDPAYGAVGDGTTDDTNAITAANQAASVNGGILYFPPGTYITTAQTLYPNVYIVGCGPAVSTLKLKAATNADLLSAQTSSISLSASLASGSAGTLSNFGIANMTLDGNKANQSSGTSYCLRFYGYNFRLTNVSIQNGFSGGVLCDWNGADITTGDDTAAIVNGVKVHHNNNIGWQMGGPRTSMFSNFSSYRNGTHNLHLAPNAQFCRFDNSRFYNPGTGVTAVCCLVEAIKTYFSNCDAHDSDNLNIAALANDFSWTGGNIYSSTGATIVGIQFGQNAGLTPFSGSILQSAGLTTAATVTNCFLVSTIYDCNTGAINEVNVGVNIYNCRIHQTAGSAYASGGGFASNGAAGWLVVSGLTPDGSMGKGGYMIPGQVNCQFAFALLDQSNNPQFVVDTFDQKTYVSDSKNFYGYSDANASVQTFLLNSGNGNATFAGALATGQSASAAVIASSGTITTSNVGVARVAPTANVNGVILGAGSTAGQQVTVSNESAFSIQFAASGTSNVAAGVADIIQANTKRSYSWDSGTSLWYGEPIVGQQSATAAATASSGTITTAGVDQARVNPSGNITGVILQAGTYANQPCTVVNESAFTVTFAAVGTSNVADGTSAVIAANRCMIFRWDSGVSKWYHA